jgi:hypothetical protein
MCLLKSQNQVRELEGQIKTQKAQLADTAWTLYTRQRLSEDELKEICAAITQLHEQIRQQQTLQEVIKNESPPDQTYSSAVPSSAGRPVIPQSGQWACPKCGRLVPVRFCLEHGVEGVPVP